MIHYRNLKKSLGYAFFGLCGIWREEQNFRIEAIVGVIAILIALLLRFSCVELSILFILIGSILAAECANSALERIVDIVKPRVSEYARVVKDIVAGMMIIWVIISLLIALLLYIPKIAAVMAIVF